MIHGEWEYYKVGLVRAEWVGMGQGLVMEWRDKIGLVLFMFYDRPSSDEIKGITEDKNFRITLKDFNGVGFFALKFGDRKWEDCSFCPNLYAEAPKFELPKKGGNCPLNVILVNSQNGKVVAMRTILLDKNFTEKFLEWGKGRLLKNDIGRFKYNYVVDDVYKKFPVSEDLAKNPDIEFVRQSNEAVPDHEERLRERNPEKGE